MLLFFIFFCLLAVGFFSGIEMALITLDKFKLRHLMEIKNQRALIIGGWLKSPGKILGTTLVGTNLFVVTSSILADNFVIRYFTHNVAFISAVVMTVLILFFGEILPKSIFRRYAEKIVFRVVFFMDWFQSLCYPLTAVVLFISKSLCRLLGGEEKGPKAPFVTKEELKCIAKYSMDEGKTDIEREKMIDRALNLSKMTIKEIMIPLEKAIMLDIESSVEEAISVAKKYNYSRIPVYEKKPEKIKGLINIYDILFDTEQKESLKEYLRYPYNLYKNEKLSKALYLLKDNRRPLAVVIDNDKECQGIVTVEDIIKKLIGEVEV